MRALLASCLVLLLSGCAGSQPPPRDEATEVAQALVQLSDRALATARSGEDLRTAIRRDLKAGPHDAVVRIAGHRFLLGHATLDVIPPGPLAGRYRWLLAQSVELAEQRCLRFPQPEPEGWIAMRDEAGTVTLATHADQLQRVDVGIELRAGCIVALHVEQASPIARD
jgi:hypothetical protein